MEPIVDLSDTGKNPLCQRASYRDYAVSEVLGIRVNCSDSESSCFRMQSDFCLINLPCWLWLNIMSFFFHTLAELTFLISIMLEDDHA